jgi:two-component system response regulator RegA
MGTPNNMTEATVDILLVEDDDVFARVMSRALKQRELTVAIAHDAETAFSLIAQTEFVYAILDLNLGGHTSLRLIPILKENNPGIKILILTGYASIATAVEAIKLGADNYLAKPANADEIMTALIGEQFSLEGDELSLASLEPMSVRRLEWEHIQKVLMENHGNISETARQLKMHRRTLQRKLQKRPVAK